MQTKEFRPVHLNNLTIDNLFSLCKSTIEHANPVRIALAEYPKLFWISSKTDNNAMGANEQGIEERPDRTSNRTDLDCDDRFAEVKRNVNTNLRGQPPEKESSG